VRRAAERPGHGRRPAGVDVGHDEVGEAVDVEQLAGGARADGAGTHEDEAHAG
jgi:hypothetical protein